MNKGVPSSSCFESFAIWFFNYAKYGFVTCFIFTFLCLVLVIWVCVFQRFCLLQDQEYIDVMNARSDMMM